MSTSHMAPEGREAVSSTNDAHPIYGDLTPEECARARGIYTHSMTLTWADACDIAKGTRVDREALRASWSCAESVPADVAQDLRAVAPSDAAVEAAMDAFYPGEDWRAVFSEPAPKFPNGTLHVHVAEMRAAIAAACVQRDEALQACKAALLFCEGYFDAIPTVVKDALSAIAKAENGNG